MENINPQFEPGTFCYPVQCLTYWARLDGMLNRQKNKFINCAPSILYMSLRVSECPFYYGLTALYEIRRDVLRLETWNQYKFIISLKKNIFSSNQSRKLSLRTPTENYRNPTISHLVWPIRGGRSRGRLWFACLSHIAPASSARCPG